MSLLPTKLVRIDSSARQRRRAHPRRHGFGFERLETRITLSTTTGIALESSSASHPAIQGETVSVGDFFLERFPGGFLVDADHHASYVVLGSSWNTWNRPTDLFFLADSLADSTLIAGRNTSSLSGDSANGLGQIATIRPPDPTPDWQPDGGAIVISELFIPLPRSQGEPAATKSVASRPTAGPNLGRTIIPVHAQEFPAAQGREMAFEVAAAQPQQTVRPTKSTFHTAMSVGPSIGSPNVPSDLLSPEDVALGPRMDGPSPLPDSSTAGVPRAKSSSPRTEAAHIPDGSSKEESIGGPLEVDQAFEPFAQRQFLPAGAADPPLRFASSRHGTIKPSAREQVFADWQATRSQAAQTREQDDRTHAWEVLAALVTGGWIIRSQYLPAGNGDQQEPPRRRKRVRHEDLA